MGVTIGQVLRQAALRGPGRVGAVDLGGGAQPVWTCAELDLGARRLAAALRARGVGPGARIGLVAANSAAFVQAWFGIVYDGATVVPLPVLSTPAEARQRFEHAGCALIIADDERRRSVVASSGLRAESLEALLAADVEPLARVADADPGSTAMILYTSGTTGRPRGAAISHAALVAHTATLSQHTLGLTPDDVVLGALPLSHSFGCRMVMLASLYVGARMVLVPRFHPEGTLRAMHEQGVTWAPAVPTMFAAWGNVSGARPPPRLRWCLSAGAPLSPDIALRAEAVLGAEVRQGYGMTEATFSTVNAPPDARVLGSVGRPVWGVEVRIVDADGRDLPVGEAGEVLVRGPNMMTGYLDDAAATAEAMRDGWIHSGDVGRLDPEGRLIVVDRLKDLVIRGGNNIYPAVVEHAMAEHPDVSEVVVVGRPDAYYGEEVVAVVVPAPGARIQPERLVAWARERVGRAKFPREIAVVDRLPMGPSGKVLRRELRRQVASGEIVPERPGPA